MDYFDEDRRRERAATSGFVRAVRQGDVAAFYDAMEEVETTWGWRPAFRACARLDNAPDEIRAVFLRMWLTAGETLRSNIGDDLVLLPALRVLLPPYTGGSVRLFRGDSFGNRLRRTYGMSWSSD